MTDLTNGEDLNEAFKMQEFTSRDQYPMLDMMEEEIEKHYNESFEKKFNEMFQKRFDEEFNKKIELLVAELEPKSSFDIFGYIKSSVRSIFASFLDILRKNQYLNNLLRSSYQKSTTSELTELTEVVVMSDVPVSAESYDDTIRPLSVNEMNIRYKTLLKQREEHDKELLEVSVEDASVEFKKRGFTLPCESNVTPVETTVEKLL